jgi:hypothetical protein
MNRLQRQSQHRRHHRTGPTASLAKSGATLSFIGEQSCDKKFKTVAGYLRSMHDNLSHRQGMARLRGGTSLSDEEVERQVINSLLPQTGIGGVIGPTEKPREGIHRLRQTVQDEQHIKILNDCLKWLGRPHWNVTTSGDPVSSKTLTSAVIPQVKTAQGQVSYHVSGFKRDDTKSNVHIIVDAEEIGGERPHSIAARLAGPDYCFCTSINISVLVPDNAKNILFTSDEGLYAVIPELNPHQRRRASR